MIMKLMVKNWVAMFDFLVLVTNWWKARERHPLTRRVQLRKEIKDVMSCLYISIIGPLFVIIYNLVLNVKISSFFSTWLMFCLGYKKWEWTSDCVLVILWSRGKQERDRGPGELLLGWISAPLLHGRLLIAHSPMGTLWTLHISEEDERERERW